MVARPGRRGGEGRTLQRRGASGGRGARRRTGAAAALALVTLAVIAGALLGPSLLPARYGAGGDALMAGHIAVALETSAALETTGSVGGTDTPGASETTAPAEATVTPTPETTPTPRWKPLRPAPGRRTIVVDMSSQRVTLYKADGTAIDRFPCATARTYPRIGRYRVWGHRKQSWALTENWTFFYFTKFATSAAGHTIGFHSIPQRPNGTLVGGLGKPISHGCVRLAKKKAKFVYYWAKNGTRVIVKR